MPTNIIAESLNLQSLKFDKAITHENFTETYLKRDPS